MQHTDAGGRADSRWGGSEFSRGSYLDGIKVSRGLNGHAYILQVKGHRDNTTAVRGERWESRGSSREEPPSKVAQNHQGGWQAPQPR